MMMIDIDVDNEYEGDVNGDGKTNYKGIEDDVNENNEAGVEGDVGFC